MKKSKIYGVCAVTFIIDQMIKLIVSNNMEILSSIKIIPNFFSITYIENEGAAFGIFSGSTLILILVSIGAFFLLNKFLEQEKKISILSGIGYGMILGGIVGNLVDRLLYGIVRDFLHFQLFGYDCPIFNIADIAIVLGVMILMIDVVRSEINERRGNTRRQGKKN